MVFKLSPNINNFRDMYSISTTDEVMKSAQERYLNNREVTVLASLRHGVSDSVQIYHAKPGADKRNLRMRKHLEYAKRFEQQTSARVSFNNDPDLPKLREDCLRLFIAFRILSETHTNPKAQDEMALFKQEALATIIDLCPGAVIVHGRVTPNRNIKLDRFGVARPG